jgi:hypothetical protein
MKRVMTIECLRSSLILCVLLLGCERGRSDVRLGDLFFGIAIGSDSSDAIDAMSRRGWYREVARERSSSQPPPLFFLERGGEGQLVTHLSDNEVSLIWRMWAPNPDDTVAWRYLDSVRSAFDERFSRSDHEPDEWIVATEPDTIFLSFTHSRRRSEVAVLEALVITARELRRLRANVTNN